MKKILVFTPALTWDWQSIREIIPSLDRAWMSLASKELRVKVVTPEVTPRRLWAKWSLEADLIVFTFMTEFAVNWAFFLRSALNAPGAMVFHIHGEGTKAALAFESLDGLLRGGDAAICASRADAAAWRLCFPRMKTVVSPFPLNVRTRSIKKIEQSPAALVYAGRISEQKNLHVFFLALGLLKRQGRLPFDVVQIYGAADGWGSPNMGRVSRGYLRLLRRLARDLGLQGLIQWKGRVSAAALKRRFNRKGFVFVSPSLHSDENFGVAALQALSAGSRAVLSDWGGHSDHARRFPGRVRLVKVYGAETGPFLSVSELAEAIHGAANPDNGFVASVARHEPDVALAFRELARSACNRGGFVRASRLAKEVWARKAKLNRAHPSKVFLGYDDALAQPFFESYGMRTRRPPKLTARNREGLTPVPWARCARNNAVIDDPHRGRFKVRKRSAADLRDWLWKNGYLVC